MSAKLQVQQATLATPKGHLWKRAVEVASARQSASKRARKNPRREHHKGAAVKGRSQGMVDGPWLWSGWWGVLRIWILVRSAGGKT